jgi:hypothetical protein
MVEEGMAPVACAASVEAKEANIETRGIVLVRALC